MLVCPGFVSVNNFMNDSLTFFWPKKMWSTISISMAVIVDRGLRCIALVIRRNRV